MFSLFIVLLLTLNSERITFVCMNPTYPENNSLSINLNDLSYVTNCSTNLRGGQDMYRISGTCGPRYLPTINNSHLFSINVLLWKNGAHNYVAICLLQRGKESVEKCQSLSSADCQCNRADLFKNESMYFEFTVRADVGHSGGLIRVVYRHENGTAIASQRKLELPYIYDDNIAEKILKLNKENLVEDDHFCGGIALPQQENVIELCCANSALPCYPRIAFNGSVVAENQSTCVTYTFFPPDVNYVVNVTGSISVCSLSNYMTTTSCLLSSRPPSWYPKENSISVTGDLVFGSTVTMTCTCDVPIEYELTNITFRDKSMNTFARVTKSGIDYGKVYHSRLNFTWNLPDGNLNMKISSLECSDAREYYCWCYYSHLNVKTMYQPSIFTLPRNLKIKLEWPGSHNIGSKMYIVPVGTDITAMFIVDVDRTFTLEMVTTKWIVYHNYKPEIVSVSDRRLTKLKSVDHGQTLNTSCYQRFTQAFVMSTNNISYIISFVCFLSYQNFTNKNIHCGYPENETCVQSAMLVISHPKEEFTLRQSTNARTRESNVLVIIAIVVICICAGIIVCLSILG